LKIENFPFYLLFDLLFWAIWKYVICMNPVLVFSTWGISNIIQFGNQIPLQIYSPHCKMPLFHISVKLYKLFLKITWFKKYISIVTFSKKGFIWLTFKHQRKTKIHQEWTKLVHFCQFHLPLHLGVKMRSQSIVNLLYGLLLHLLYSNMMETPKSFLIYVENDDTR